MDGPEDRLSQVRACLVDFKGRTVIRLDFPYDQKIINEVRAIRGRIWSATLHPVGLKN